MNTTHQANAEQIALWNGCAARGWIDAKELLDQVLEPFEDLLVEAVAERKAQRVLDIGCGTGATTLAVARLLAKSNGAAVGLDVSEPMMPSQENAPSGKARWRASSAPTRRRTRSSRRAST